MNNDMIFEVTIVQVISIVLLLIAIIYLLKQSRFNKYERRLEDFSLVSLKDKEKPLLDRVINSIFKIVKLLSKNLEKHNFTPGLAMRYEKYIKFEDRLKKSGYDYIAGKLCLSMLIGIFSFITMMFQYTKFNLSFFVLVLILGFYLPDIYLIIDFKNKRKRIEEDLLKAIIIMNSAFKSGSNITQAVQVVKDNLSGPISDEFKKIYIDINYGLSLDVVFNRFYERVKIDDIKYITSSLTLLNKTGGNIVNVFTLIEKTFFDRKKLRNELKSLTASSVFIYRLLLVMPFVLSLVIFILNKTYFAPFFNSLLGIISFVILILLYILYVIIVNKILKVKI